ncbi:hypothetical protein [Actinomadura parmotrematis]|uniref:DUF222 domain-containing protein n=1 Tax=Actinomadura parmotrematis TaxID=2864039 RepID=A0ABS7G399_9ACTN|nr:hypothetical protein [Actinomadura parmotrematis]MBW8486297.1 hypothetical protein [Actinomadura parmotrematis]
MAHTSGCAEAQKHKCVCGGCGGLEHGWRGHLRLAVAPPADRAAFRARADAAWSTATRRKRPEPSERGKAAATDTAIADIVDWLAANGRAIEQVEELGTAIAGEAPPLLAPELEAHGRTACMKAMTDHFWCELLACFARVLSDVKEQLDLAPGLVAREILASRQAYKRSLLADTVARAAVHATWEVVQRVSFAARLDDLIRAVRILAVLICKAPEHHAAVARNCLDPLSGEVISTATQERLMQIFPAEWLQETRTTLAS